METEEERYLRYLDPINRGVIFASNPDMEAWAKKKVEEGFLKPLSTLVGSNGSDYWYCLKEYKEEDLLKYFSPSGLGQLFGIHKHCLEYQI